MFSESYEELKKLMEPDDTGFIFLQKIKNKNDPIDTLIRIRLYRNKLLLESDKYVLPDFPISDEKREEWNLYRQQLRNITNDLDASDFMLLLHEGEMKVYKETFLWPVPPN